MIRSPFYIAGGVGLLFLFSVPSATSTAPAADFGDNAEFATLAKRDWTDAATRLNLDGSGPIKLALDAGEASGINYFSIQQSKFRARGRKKTVPRGPEDAVAAVVSQEPRFLARSVPAIAKADAADATSGGAAAATGDQAWIPLGPAPIPNGQTSPANENGISLTQSPVSGRTGAIQVHPTNPNIAYVGTAQAGLYRTMDGGATWTPLLDNALTLAVGSVKIDPSDPSRVIVGTGEGVFSGDSFAGVGIYVITGADSATPVLNGPYNIGTDGKDVLTGRCVKGLAVDNTGEVVFASTVTGIQGKTGVIPAGAPFRGLFRSTNFKSGSPTFEKLPVLNEVGPPVAATHDYRISAVVVEPGNANNVICGLVTADGAPPQGLYRSTNALSATPVFTKVLDTSGSDIGPVRLAINKNPTSGAVTVVAIDGTPNGDGENHGRVFVSTDAGATFTEKPNGRGFAGPQGFYNLGVDIHPTDGNIFYVVGTVGRNDQAGQVDVGDNGTFIFTRDGGANFEASTRTLHVDSHAVAVSPSNPNVVYTGNDGGIWRSNDAGLNWIDLNTPTFSATQFVGMAQHPIDRNFIIGGTQDNGTEFRRPDGTWKRADFGDGGFSAIDQNAENTEDVTMYHTYFNAQAALAGFARVLKSDCATEGQWAFRGAYLDIVPPSTIGIVLTLFPVCDGSEGVANNGVNPADFVNFYAPMALGPGNPNTVYFGTDKLYRSDDRGETMVAVSQPLSPSTAPPGFSPVSAIAISPQSDDVRLVGTNNGGVFATTVGGPLLPVRSASMPTTPVERTAIDPTNTKVAYVAFGGSFGSASPLAANGHIWKTTNLNAATPTWTPMGAGIPDVPVNGFAIDPQNPDHLYAGTDRGVYNSTDGGATWAAYGTALPNVSVFDLQIHNPSRLLRAATHGRGIWEIPLVLSPPQPPTTRLLNLATRANVGAGDRVLIGGLIITGTAQKRVIIRGLGPSLSDNGVPAEQTLQDPALELYDQDGVLIVRNDDWRDNQEAEIQETGLAPKRNNEAAIVRSLDPGRYTAVVFGKGGSTGIGLAETYDLGATGDPRLANISTRGFVETGDNVLIGGFIIGGGDAAAMSTIVTRAIGPSLSNANVPDPLQDPTVELFDANGTSIAFNDNWKQSQQAELEQAQLAPSDDREAAILRALPNGAYTAIVRGANDSTGTALVELYNVL